MWIHDYYCKHSYYFQELLEESVGYTGEILMSEFTKIIIFESLNEI